MHHVIFQRQDARERGDTIRQLLGTIDGAVVVVSPDAKRLAEYEQPSNRANCRVIRLLHDGPDALNPLDVLRFHSPNFMYDQDRCNEHLDRVISALLRPLTEQIPLPLIDPAPSALVREPSWQMTAVQLLETVTRHCCRRKKGIELVDVINQFFADDADDRIKSLLDSHLVDPVDRAVLTAFLSRTEAMRRGIIGAIWSMISQLDTHVAHRALGSTTVDWEKDLAHGTVYIQSPFQPHDSFAHVVRVWCASLFQFAGSSAGPRPMTFIVDNASAAGLFPQLDEARRTLEKTVVVWSICENVDYLTRNYPTAWAAFFDSCQSIRAQGPQGPLAASELASIFAVPKSELLQLRTGEVLDLVGASKSTINVPPACKQCDTPNSIMQANRAFILPRNSERWSWVEENSRQRPDQPIVIIESAGECHSLTAASRRGPVHCLDPFEVLKRSANGAASSDHFNPLDLLSDNSPVKCLDEYQVAEILTRSSVNPVDALWRSGNVSLIRSALQYLIAVPEKKLTLPQLWDEFHKDDVIYNFAVVLDTIGKRLPKNCYRAIAAFLHCGDSHRARQLQEVSACLAAYGDPAVRTVVEGTTLNLGELFDAGAALYIEIPVALAPLYGSLVRLWFAALVELSRSGDGQRRHSPLFVVEHPHQLKLLPQLHEAQLRSSGAPEVWGLWESFAQIQSRESVEGASYLAHCELVEPVAGVSSSPMGKAASAAVVGLQCNESRESTSTKATVEALAHRHTMVFVNDFSQPWSEAAVRGSELGRTTIVVESAGEHYKRHFKDGSRTYIRLDPFGVLGAGTDTLNPFASLNLAHSAAFADRIRIADAIVGPDNITVDSFWRYRARGTLSGVLGLLCWRARSDYSGSRNASAEATTAEMSKVQCTPANLFEMLSSDDVVYNLAKSLDDHGKRMPRDVYGLISSFLQEADGVKSSVLADIQTRMEIFGDPKVIAATGEATFALEEIAEGNLTIYIELPVQWLGSCQILLELWTLTLLRYCEIAAPEKQPQMIVDQPFASALFPLLHVAQATKAVALCTSWSSLDQIRIRSPADWSAFVSTAQIEATGPLSRIVARELAAEFNVPVAKLYSLSDGQTSSLQ